MKVSPGMGAPAFKISQLDQHLFQLHYAEWSEEDFNVPEATLTTNTYFGTYATEYLGFLPNPMRSTYPSGGNLNYPSWDVETTSHTHANWWP